MKNLKIHTPVTLKEKSSKTSTFDPIISHLKHIFKFVSTLLHKNTSFVNNLQVFIDSLNDKALLLFIVEISDFLIQSKNFTLIKEIFKKLKDQGDLLSKNLPKLIQFLNNEKQFWISEILENKSETSSQFSQLEIVQRKRKRSEKTSKLKNIKIDSTSNSVQNSPKSSSSVQNSPTAKRLANNPTFASPNFASPGGILKKKAYAPLSTLDTPTAKRVQFDIPAFPNSPLGKKCFGIKQLHVESDNEDDVLEIDSIPDRIEEKIQDE
ncbi:hypothetical protein ROZALSC1DRAFT_30995, partial [Rozella allomycis CSF55]